MTTPPLTPAEQTAYAEVYSGAHNADHSMVGLKPGASCKRCEATARAVVAAVRKQIAADALAWVAASPERWEGYCCHDHMAGVVMKAAEEIKAGLDTVDDEAAEAALDDHYRWEVARRLKDERDLITDHADDLEYSRRRVVSRLKARIEGARLRRYRSSRSPRPCRSIRNRGSRSHS